VSVWGGKKGGIITVSPGKLGGALAAAQLRQILAFLNIDILCQPECYLQADETLRDGVLSDGGLKNFLKSYVEAFRSFVA
jgi:chromate reductase